jgi:mercuric ion transport protein
MPQSQEDPGSRLGGSLAAGAAVLLAVTCCAGPVLVAAGALGVAGGLLRSPAVLAIAALALVGAVLYVLHRRRSGRAAAADPTVPQERATDCCAPGPTDRRSLPTQDLASRHSQEP